MKLIDRFIQYVKIDTQSDASSSSIPSTSKQLGLLDMLKNELLEMGIQQVTLEKNGNLYVHIPSRTKGEKSPIGFLAHVDTASEMSGKDVSPKIFSNYHGKKISLDAINKIVLDPLQFPTLKKHKGKTLVTTSGNTLLGADDKAGIAIIMTFIESIIKNPINYHPIYIAFTTDEEIGRGLEGFNLDYFKPRFAYTVDGGPIDEFNYENFNASSATISIQGKAIHPGSAKNQMINSQTLAAEFHQLIPKRLRPENTSNYQGFIHLVESKGNVELTQLHYIIRHHKLSELVLLEKYLKNFAAQINGRYKFPFIKVTINRSYLNMKPVLDKQPEALQRAFRAYQHLKMKVKAVPIRGGTDGAHLSYKGIPTPNLGTGGENFHGKYEFLVVEDAEKMVEVLREIVRVKP